MKNNKNIILELLVTGMKHEQLLTGLSRLGFNSEVHELDLSGIVLQLMGRSEAEMSWPWFSIYMKQLSQATRMEITAGTEHLLPLAEGCFVLLHDQLQTEDGR